MSNYKQGSILQTIDGIQHGFFTRQGGVSTGDYNSLNCSPSSDDDINHVEENRRRVMSLLQAQDGKLFGLSQIHSTTVFVIDKEMSNTNYRKGDAMVSNQAGVYLSVLGADCTPVLFANASGTVIGAAHAGWRGAVGGIVEEVVLKMCELGAKREEISACIGPTIHQASYQVQQDFIDQLNQLSRIPAAPFLQQTQGQHTFNLPAYLQAQCQHSGIQCQDLKLDTYQLADEFFSYRRNTHQGLKDYGRQVSVIGLSASR